MARLVLGGAFVLGSLAVLAAVRPLRRGAIVVLSGFLIVLVWFFLIPPSNDRDWQRDVAVLAHATIDGDRVTIENVRNNAYRSETDYTPRYETRTYDLKALRSVDLFLVYWGSPHLYAIGAVRQDLPLAELRARGHVNNRARAAEHDADFSRRVREGVPARFSAP